MKNSKAEKFKKLGIISQEESKEKHYGKRGTEKRDAFEEELQIEIIGALLKKYRQAKHITQGQIAQRMDLKDKTYVSKIESNKVGEIKISTLKSYLNALNAKRLTISIEIEEGKKEELVLI